MAAAPMQRPPYNQQIYHPPQSNSPTTIVPQQNHDYPRVYQPQNQMTSTVHYGNYTPSNQLPSYSHHPGHSPAQAHGLSGHPMLLSHPQTQPSYALPPSNTGHPSIASLTQPKVETSFPRSVDQSKPQGSSITSPTSTISPSSAGPHSGSTGGSSNSSAGPGPIPANGPLTVKVDENGVRWINFEYSKNREKMEFDIRTDVQTVNLDELPAAFKDENCIYPRACCSKEAYKGNRYNYETDCNNVGWGLAHLNPALRGKRGLIQRAVDSYRNSNCDLSLRSRRVRRQAKEKSRLSAQSNPGVGYVGNSSSMARPQSMPTNMQHQSLAGPHYQHQAYSMHMHQSPTNHSGSVPHNGPQDISETPQNCRASPTAIQASKSYSAGLSMKSSGDRSMRDTQYLRGHDTSLSKIGSSKVTGFPRSEWLLPPSRRLEIVIETKTPGDFSEESKNNDQQKSTSQPIFAFPDSIPSRSQLESSSQTDFGGLSSPCQTSLLSLRRQCKRNTVPKTAHVEPEAVLRELYGSLPKHKWRTYIHVNECLQAILRFYWERHERQGGSTLGAVGTVNQPRLQSNGTPPPKVRVNVNLEIVDLLTIPDSQRKEHSVFPRAYRPQQMPVEKAEANFCPRMAPEAEHNEEPGSSSSVDLPAALCSSGNATVSFRLLSSPYGRQRCLNLPRLSPQKVVREHVLNDIAYRIMWLGNGKFSGRLLFLQRTLDTWRAQIRSLLVKHAADARKQKLLARTRTPTRTEIQTPVPHQPSPSTLPDKATPTTTRKHAIHADPIEIESRAPPLDWRPSTANTSSPYPFTNNLPPIPLHLVTRMGKLHSEAYFAERSARRAARTAAKQAKAQRATARRAAREKAEADQESMMLDG